MKNVDMNSIPNYDTLKMTGHLTTQFHTLYRFLIFNARNRTAKWINYAREHCFMIGNIPKVQKTNKKNPWAGAIYCLPLEGKVLLDFEKLCCSRSITSFKIGY